MNKNSIGIYIAVISMSIISLGFTFDDAYADIEQFDTAILAIENANYLNADEKKMLMEINIVRVFPQKYLGTVEELLSQTVADSIRLSSMISESINKRVVYEDYGEVITIDTVRNNYYNSRIVAIKELIQELKVAAPLNALIPSETMFVSAKKHGTNQTVNNYIDHHGIDGTWPMDRLVKDSPWNILNPAWTHFTCYNVKELNREDYKWWIQEFAR